MRALRLTALALFLGCCATSAAASGGSIEAHFAAFKARYNRRYASADEETRRFRIFASNMAKAAQLQSANPHASFGINAFADVSEAEFKTRHNGEKYYAARVAEAKLDQGSAKKKTVTPREAKAAAGAKVDWRQHGAVTPIKNQGQCGSCWSFSTTGGIEGQWFLAGHELVSLSEQEFVSCDTIDHACKGGLMDNAYKWILDAHNGTLVTEASYPYVSGGGYVPTCNMTGTKPAATIVGYHNLENNEDVMAAWTLTHGPLSIAVDATSWQMYTGGVMTNCLGIALDHGVLIVGFDDTFVVPYWIVKNSWGTEWGEEGYIRVAKGSDQCLITIYPTTAEVKSVGPTPLPGPTVKPEPTPPSGTPTAAPPLPKAWTELIPPPYSNAPQIVLALSCLSGDSCIVPGGSNGAGFSVFNFNGQRNGYFHPMTLPNVGGMDMLMAAGAGGSAENPKGAVGGMDFGATPFFLTGKYTLNASLALPFVVTQSISADRATGKLVLLADGFDGNEDILWFSNNGGETYSNVNASGANFTYHNCTFPNSQVIVDANTWYVVVGGNPAPPPNPNPPPSPFPPKKIAAATLARNKAQLTPHTIRRNRGFENLLGEDVEILHRKSSVHAIVRERQTGKVKHAFVNITKYLKEQEVGVAPLREDGCPFVAGIMKTTDAGKTWEKVFESVNQGYMMDFIDCASATHCVAVGSGANMTHTPGAHVFTSTDGRTFTETLVKLSSSTQAYFISGVQFVPGTNGQEVWVAGSVQTQTGGAALFWYSNDGGHTWTEKGDIGLVMALTDLSFGNDGNGFASGLTVLQDSTIMRYDPKGVPATPAPTWTGNITQIVCNTTGDCSGKCFKTSFPQNVCLNLTNGFSATANCDMADGVIMQNVYPLDKVCWGPAEQQLVPLDVCLVANPGTIKFVCGDASSVEAEEISMAQMQALTSVKKSQQ